MSFCIAKIIDGKAYIHTDSLLSGDDVTRHMAEKQTILKAVLINHHLCLLFAGNVEVANALIKRIFQSFPMSLNDMKQMIYLDHIRQDLVTDYILVNTFNNKRPYITEIKNGVGKDRLTSSWIGSSEAFNSFQMHFDQQKKETTVLSEAFRSAAIKVIEHESIPGVGGFHFEVEPIQGSHIYVGNPMILNYSMVMHTVVIANYGTLDEEGFYTSDKSTKANGGFAHTILQSVTIEYPGVGIHFGHVDLGLLFVPKLNGIYPITFNNCTGPEFIESAKQKGVILAGSTVDNETNEAQFHRNKDV